MMKLNVKRYVNSIFTSNTYLVWQEGLGKGLIVDCGDTDALLKDAMDMHLKITDVLLTHVHFDHIYGLNKLLGTFPEVIVNTNLHGYEALLSDKLNMSRYHRTPFIFENKERIHVIEEGPLMAGEIEIHIVETPGHNPSCLTYYTDKCIFTGDSYIPGVKVITNLPRGNKEQAMNSLQKIAKLSKGKAIYPGHGDKEDSR